jgi:hypothetical protein
MISRRPGLQSRQARAGYSLPYLTVMLRLLLLSENAARYRFRITQRFYLLIVQFKRRKRALLACQDEYLLCNPLRMQIRGIHSQDMPCCFYGCRFLCDVQPLLATYLWYGSNFILRLMAFSSIAECVKNHSVTRLTCAFTACRQS